MSASEIQCSSRKKGNLELRYSRSGSSSPLGSVPTLIVLEELSLQRMRLGILQVFEIHWFIIVA